MDRRVSYGSVAVARVQCSNPRQELCADWIVVSKHRVVLLSSSTNCVCGTLLENIKAKTRGTVAETQKSSWIK